MERLLNKLDQRVQTGDNLNNMWGEGQLCVNPNFVSEMFRKRVKFNDPNPSLTERCKEKTSILTNKPKVRPAIKLMTRNFNRQVGLPTRMNPQNLMAQFRAMNPTYHGLNMRGEILNPKWQPRQTMYNSSNSQIELEVYSHGVALPIANDNIEQISMSALRENYATSLNNPLSNTYALVHLDPATMQEYLGSSKDAQDAIRKQQMQEAEGSVLPVDMPQQEAAKMVDTSTSFKAQSAEDIEKARADRGDSSEMFGDLFADDTWDSNSKNKLVSDIAEDNANEDPADYADTNFETPTTVNSGVTGGIADSTHRVETNNSSHNGATNEAYQNNLRAFKESDYYKKLHLWALNGTKRPSLSANSSSYDQMNEIDMDGNPLTRNTATDISSKERSTRKIMRDFQNYQTPSTSGESPIGLQEVYSVRRKIKQLTPSTEGSNISNIGEFGTPEGITNLFTPSKKQTPAPTSYQTPGSIHPKTLEEKTAIKIKEIGSATAVKNRKSKDSDSWSPELLSNLRGWLDNNQTEQPKKGKTLMKFSRKGKRSSSPSPEEVYQNAVAGASAHASNLINIGSNITPSPVRRSSTTFKPGFTF